MNHKIEYSPSCWLIQDEDKLVIHSENIQKSFLRAINRTGSLRITVKLKKNSDTEATMIRLDTFFGNGEGICIKEEVSKPSLVQYALIDEKSVEYINNKLENALMHIVALSAIEAIY